MSVINRRSFIKRSAMLGAAAVLMPAASSLCKDAIVKQPLSPSLVTPREDFVQYMKQGLRKHARTVGRVTDTSLLRAPEPTREGQELFVFRASFRRKGYVKCSAFVVNDKDMGDPACRDYLIRNLVGLIESAWQSLT